MGYARVRTCVHALLQYALICNVTYRIVDLHSHIGDSSSPELNGALDSNSLKGTTQPWLRALDGLNTHDASYSLSVSGGVTTALVLPGSANAIGKVNDVLDYMQESHHFRIPHRGPRLYYQIAQDRRPFAELNAPRASISDQLILFAGRWSSKVAPNEVRIVTSSFGPIYHANSFGPFRHACGRYQFVKRIMLSLSPVILGCRRESQYVSAFFESRFAEILTYDVSNRQCIRRHPHGHHLGISQGVSVSPPSAILCHIPY